MNLAFSTFRVANLVFAYFAVSVWNNRLCRIEIIATAVYPEVMEHFRLVLKQIILHRFHSIDNYMVSSCRTGYADFSFRVSSCNFNIEFRSYQIFKVISCDCFQTVSFISDVNGCVVNTWLIKSDSSITYTVYDFNFNRTFELVIFSIVSSDLFSAEVTNSMSSESITLVFTVTLKTSK